MSIKAVLFRQPLFMLLSIAGCNEFTGLDSDPFAFVEQVQILFRG